MALTIETTQETASFKNPAPSALKKPNTKRTPKAIAESWKKESAALQKAYQEGKIKAYPNPQAMHKAILQGDEE